MYTVRTEDMKQYLEDPRTISVEKDETKEVSSVVKTNWRCFKKGVFSEMDKSSFSRVVRAEIMLLWLEKRAEVKKMEPTL